MGAVAGQNTQVREGLLPIYLFIKFNFELESFGFLLLLFFLDLFKIFLWILDRTVWPAATLAPPIPTWPFSHTRSFLSPCFPSSA